jgi:hypothetical protein
MGAGGIFAASILVLAIHALSRRRGASSRTLLHLAEIGQGLRSMPAPATADDYMSWASST